MASSAEARMTRRIRHRRCTIAPVSGRVVVVASGRPTVRCGVCVCVLEVGLDVGQAGFQTRTGDFPGSSHLQINQIDQERGVAHGSEWQCTVESGVQLGPWILVRVRSDRRFRVGWLC
eukprot:2212904-Prymnesium_polylepis.2